ncbi:hypothetical protein TNCV_942581 [Trichonephila clavipes]|nr:hypothetical protein TNCV_942581 [Trichonephila clavipes]
MVERGNRCQATSTAECTLSTVYASGPRLMSCPMRSHRCSMEFRSGDFARQGRMSNTVRLFRIHLATCGLALFCRNTVGVTLQQEQNNRLHNLCDKVVHR